MSENKVSNSFCVRPWNHLQVKNNGVLRFCCDAKRGQILKDEKLLYAPHAPLASIMHSNNLKRIKSQLQVGERPLECQKCWDTEDCGGKSLRQKINSAWPTEKAMQGIQSIELRLGNHCNLKCRMCGPQNSTSWYSDYKMLHGTQFVTDDHVDFDFANSDIAFDWHQDIQKVMSWIEQVAPNLEEIQFVGGEPLIISNHIKLLRLLIESQKAKDLNLRYTTNATYLPEILFSLWAQFKEVTLSASIDATGSVFEYIRTPAKWSSIEKNLKRLESEIGKSVKKVSIQPTANIYNAHNLIHLSEWTLSHLKNIQWTEHLNFQEYPSWQSMCVLSKKVRDDLSMQFKKHVSTLEKDFEISNEPRLRIISIWFQSLSDRMQAFNLTNLKDDFVEKNKALDILRDQSLEASLPLLFRALSQ